MIVITDRKFYDEFTSTGGGGVPYYNGRPGDKVTCVIEFYIKWGVENKRLTFDAATKTIVNANSLDSFSFITDGEFKAGDLFDIVNSVSNDGSYTIDTISEDGLTITTVEALVDETAEDCNLHGTTPITAIDYYYNLISNSAEATFLSLIDNGTLQRYFAKNLDASDIVTLINLTVDTNSFGWVTDNLASIESGISNDAFIRGDGITDYKQKFRLEQIFMADPLFLKDQFQNFIGDFAPDYYQNEETLKHIAKINAKFEFDDPQIIHTATIDNVNGINAWFNRGQNGSRAEYNLESIIYTDDITGDVVEQIDINRKTNVEIIINSLNGKFTTLTETILTHFICPMDESYINTPLTTFLNNFIVDRKYLIGEQTVSGGDNEGTDYQVLGEITTTRISATQFKFEFAIEFTDFLKAILKAKDFENRRYSFSITTQDIAVITTKNTDRIVVLADFRNATYDTDDAALFEFVDNFHCYHYPNRGVEEKEDFAMFEGEPAYVDIPFRVESGTGLQDKIIFVRVAALGVFDNTYTINGATPSGVFEFDPADVPTSETNFQTYLDANYTGFVASVAFDGGTNTWTVIITAPIPENSWKGVITSFAISGGDTFEGVFESTLGAQSPTIQIVKVQIIATKTGNKDFILEEKTFNSEFIRKLDDVQDIDLILERGFKSVTDNLYNTADLFRVKPFDSGTKKGYMLRYGFAARYEYWIEALPKDEGASVDVFKNVKEVTEQWSNYSLSGWDLKVRFVCEIIGYDGFVTEFFNDVAIRVLKAGSMPDFINASEEILYFDEDDDSVNSVIQDGITKLRATFTGDFSTVPVNFTTPYGSVFADYEGSSGELDRRFASTEHESEEDSPFSPTAEDLSATTSYSNGGVRINIYGTTKIVLETYYDDSIDKLGITIGSVLFYFRLGWKGTKTDCLLLLEDGSPILLETGEAVELEICP